MNLICREIGREVCSCWELLDFARNWSVSGSGERSCNRDSVGCAVQLLLLVIVKRFNGT